MIQSYVCNAAQALCDVDRGGEPTRAIGINWPFESGDGANVSTLLAIARDRIDYFRAPLDPESVEYGEFTSAMSALDDIISSLGQSGVTGG